MFLVKWLGHRACENRFVVRKARFDQVFRRRLGCSRYRRRILRLSLIFRNRLARQNYRLVARRRPVIIVAAGSARRR